MFDFCRTITFTSILLCDWLCFFSFHFITKYHLIFWLYSRLEYVFHFQFVFHNFALKKRDVTINTMFSNTNITVLRYNDFEKLTFDRYLPLVSLRFLHHENKLIIPQIMIYRVSNITFVSWLSYHLDAFDLTSNESLLRYYHMMFISFKEHKSLERACWQMTNSLRTWFTINQKRLDTYRSSAKDILDHLIFVFFKDICRDQHSELINDLNQLRIFVISDKSPLCTFLNKRSWSCCHFMSTLYILQYYVLFWIEWRNQNIKMWKWHNNETRCN